MGYHEPIARKFPRHGATKGVHGLHDLLFSPARRSACDLDHRAELAALGKATLRMRRTREDLFGKDLFAEPTWDILLDLFVSQCEGIRVTISSACIAASAPQTTGLRHLRTLEARGLIHRFDDHLDKRRSYVELTEPAYAMMVELLEGHRATVCN